MADLRESIMARLVTVCSGVSGVVSCTRNQLQVSDTALPAIQIFDGDEEAVDTGGEHRRTNAPALVEMKPLVYINRGNVSATVGSDLNAMRALVLKAILGDATLLSLIGTNGKLRYEGCQSAIQPGRQAAGQMMLAFSFIYPLRVEDL